MFNEYVNKKDVSKFLRKEIKTISERWGQFMVNKIALEKEQKLWKPLSEKEVAMHKKWKKQVSGKTSEEQVKVLNKLSKEDKQVFVEIDQRKNKEKALSDSNKGIKEFEEFLEVSTILKRDIDTQVEDEKKDDSVTLTN